MTEPIGFVTCGGPRYPAASLVKPCSPRACLAQGLAVLASGRGAREIDDLHTVLLVDDEPLVLDRFQRALHKEPYKILCAGSAEEALALLRAGPVDVVVSEAIRKQGLAKK